MHESTEGNESKDAKPYANISTCKIPKYGTSLNTIKENFGM